MRQAFQETLRMPLDFGHSKLRIRREQARKATLGYQTLALGSFCRSHVGDAYLLGFYGGLPVWQTDQK